jgi:hypothetical protein
MWANERFGEHWPGLFAIALVSAIIPVSRMVITHEHTPKSSTTAGWVLAMVQELALLLCTAAMVLLVLRPRGARAIDAAREALADTPRLVLVKIATALVRWVPAFALGAVVVGLGGGLLTIIFGFLLMPLAFVCQLAFTGAVIERSGPFAAVQDAFHRARLSGFGIVVGLAILFSIVDQLPPVIFAYLANVVFPPTPIPLPWPQFPGHTIPQPAFPGMTMPGKFGSAIPWGAHVVMLLADMPFFAYVTVLYTGAALAFADTEPRDDGPSG